jgi:bacillithiol biosynthesis cysteine-adding enzyme BshC
MISQNLSFTEVGSLSKLLEDYLSQSTNTANFIFDFDSPEGWQHKIESRDFNDAQRIVLVNSLKKQYEKAGIETPPAVECLLQPTTFTITTGHQLCLFGGPKYFIYKIVSAIKLAQHMSTLHPSVQVVPIFWMASEDHDFEEINQVTVFKKTFSTTQLAKGPVGRLKPSVFEEVYDQLKELFVNDERAKELLHHFEQSFQKEDWASATRYWVHQLFGNQLIILDGDDADLKATFAPIMEDELLNQSSLSAIEHTSKELIQLGYHAQVNPRPINLFYIETGLRELIIAETDGSFSIKNTDLRFTKNELLNLLKSHPEKFSPNVALRPVYQELILPNIAYIGGPGELAYWMQLKSNFDRLQVSFPILVLRDSFLLVQQRELAQLNEMKLALSDLFLAENELTKKYLQLNVTESIETTEERQQLVKWQQNLTHKLIAFDKDFEKMLGAEFANWNKVFEKIEQKIVKNEKSREEVSINRLLKIKNNYHPNGVLNERVDSFIPEWIKQPDYIEFLLSHSNTQNKIIKVVVQ